MRNDVRLRFDVPVSEQDSGPFLVFTHWLPLAPEDAILAQQDDIQLRLWVDMQCLGHVSDVALQDVPRHANLLVARVHVEAAPQMEDELADLVYRAHDWSRSPDGEAHERNADPTLWEAWATLGKKVLALVLQAVNRLLLYARNEKGQYWLEPLDADPDRMSSRNVQFRARVLVPPHEWVRWNPPGQYMLNARLESEERFISEADWTDINSFILGNRRPDLVLELLANAEYLFGAGRRRSAVIEAVAALEVALGEFAKSPRTDCLRSELAQRTPIDLIRQQLEHLGFSGSMRFFLPLLFSEQSLGASTLRLCWSAIDTRNNVVHHGQRDVQQEVAERQIRAVREICKLLMSATTKQDR